MKPQEPPAAHEESRKAPTRKAYQKPKLEAYGDLAEITKSNTGTHMNDGAAHPNKHFTS
jgi:hypothetical protein